MIENFTIQLMQERINELNRAAGEFVDAASSVKLSRQVYDNGWNAKNIIGHIVFYHEYYAKVVKAMADGVEDEQLPLIDESLAVVNKRSAKEFALIPRKELIERFKRANQTLTGNIVKLNKAQIPYKKGGRIYKPKEYISEIARHVSKHTKDLLRKKRGG